jgi:predicted nucleotidyltransferase
MSNAEYAIWLYGSYARKDNDSNSDIDILVIGSIDVNAVLKHFDYDRERISISQYSWEEINKMASYGSLFIYHLKTEGRLIESTIYGKKWCENIFKLLVPYHHIERDLIAFQNCVEDVESGIDMGSTPCFELSVLATVLRHSSVLASYLIGKPVFGRLEPFQFVARYWNFEDDIIDNFEVLYQFRLFEDGRGSLPFEATRNDVSIWVIRSKRYLDRLMEEYHAYQRRLSEVD